MTTLAKIAAELAKLKASTRRRRHRGVIWANDDAERDAEIARRVAAGEVAAGYGFLVVPHEESIEAWEQRQRERAPAR